MNEQEYKTVVDFENDLKVDDPVRAVWTNCGHFYRGLGTVKKINAKTFNISLTETVDHPNNDGCPIGQVHPNNDGWAGYPIGQVIQVPRIESMKLWSANNRAEPIDGY